MTNNPISFFPPSGVQPVDSGHLDYLGKQAAALAESGSLNLTDAVVRTIAKEKLSAEQVRRVVEFANTEAFNQKFSSLDPSNRVVDIEGGPADPERVIQALNDQARPQTMTLQSLDYDLPPGTKVSHDVDFGLEPVSRTREGVMQDVINLKSKLSTAHEEVVQSVESARFQLVNALKDLQSEVKTASLNGLHREDLIQAWSAVAPELVETALERMPSLPSRGNVKVAHRINPAHPVVQKYQEFVKLSGYFATCVGARQNLERRLVEVDDFFTERCA